MAKDAIDFKNAQVSTLYRKYYWCDKIALVLNIIK